MRLKKIAIGLLVCVAMLAGCKNHSEVPPLEEGSLPVSSVALESTYSNDVESSVSGENSSSGDVGTSSASGNSTTSSSSSSTSEPVSSPAPHVHNHKVIDTQEPTCVEKGWNEIACECGDRYLADIEATGHKYTQTTIEATCVNQGYTRYTCDVCGYSYDNDFKTPLEHKYGEWKTIKEPTTYSEGEEQATCTQCGKTISKAIPKPELTITPSEYTSEVVRLVNIERAKYGLSALSESSKLGEFAQVRSEEIKRNFSHTRPNGNRAVKDIMALGGLRTGGENIAMGQPTPEAVVDAWMNSEGHRANILKEDYTMIGVGCSFGGGTYYWVQAFGG